MADLLQHVRESGFAFPDQLIHLGLRHVNH